MNGKFFLFSKGFWGTALAILLEALDQVGYTLPTLTENEQGIATLVVLLLALVGRIVATQPLSLTPGSNRHTK